MKPSEVLIAHVGEDTLVLEGRGGNKFQIIGSSTSATEGAKREWVRNAAIAAPPTGTKGVLCVVVQLTACLGTRWTRQMWQKCHHTFLLETGCKNGRPWIELRRPWVPSARRLGQAGRWTVETTAEGIPYTNCRKTAGDSNGAIRYVDADTICKYLAGVIGRADLERSAGIKPTSLEEKEVAVDQWHKLDDIRREVGKTHLRLLHVSHFCVRLLREIRFFQDWLKQEADVSEKTRKAFSKEWEMREQLHPELFSGRYGSLARPYDDVDERDLQAMLLRQQIDIVISILESADDADLVRRLRYFRESGKDCGSEVAASEHPSPSTSGDHLVN